MANIDISRYLGKTGDPVKDLQLYKMAGGIVKDGYELRFINAYSNNTPTTSGFGKIDDTAIESGPIGQALGSFNKFLQKTFKGTASIISELYQSQITQGTTSNDIDAVGKLFQIIERDGLTVNTLTDLIKMGGKEIVNQLKSESQLRNDINEKTTLTGELSEKLREDMLSSSVSAAQFGYNVNDLGNAYIKLVDSTGKFALLNKTTLDNMAPVVRSFIGDMDKMGETIAQFEKVGIGANNTIKTIGEAGVKSMSLGLSGKKVVSEITTNIEKLNSYGFQKGIQGLESMIRKSFEFRMNMQNVFEISEKVMNPEGALELAANLQVLGGAFGDFNDPIKMMYDATNNVEGLQDSLIGAAQSLATYNQEQGRFEISGVNLRRAREMAKQLGISLDDLTKTAIGAAERTSAASAMLTSGLQMSDDDKEFLMNMSRMEGGEMKIILPQSLAKELNKPSEIALDKLDQNTANALISYEKQMAKMDPKEVAMNQLTETERMSRNVDVIAAYVKVVASRSIRGLAKGSGLEDEYKKLQESISNKSKNVIGETNNNSINEYGKKGERVGGAIKGVFEEPSLKSLKNVYNKISEPIPSKDNSNAQLSKDDMTQAFYDALFKWDNTTRKKDGTYVTITTPQPGSYLS